MSATPLAAAPHAAMPAEPPDRKRNILLAAQRLFAEHGYHGVSIRDVAREAHVPLALVGYYYGAKHELYAAIFESWRPTMEARLQRLAEALAEPLPMRRLDRILAAFVSPVLALQRHEEGRYYARMAARDLAAPTPELEALQSRFFDPMANAFIDALQSVAPDATRGQVAWCYQFMLGALLHFMTDKRVEHLSGGENRATDPHAEEELLRFIGAGFRAVLQLPST
jgi:AcrR family transcriptional regulator